MDGSQKLPQRLLATIRRRLALNLPIPHLALAVPGWVRYAGGTDLAGRRIDVRDPLADLLRSRLQPCLGDTGLLADAALGVTEVFDTDLGKNEAFRTQLTQALASLHQWGAMGSIGRLMSP